MAEQTRKRRVSLLAPLIIFRILNSLLTRSFFQPDEFWQSLEPAHFKAFDFGELTWDWKYGLRSYAFPSLFELSYHIVKQISHVSTKIVAINVELFTLFVAHLFPSSELGWEMVYEMNKFPDQLGKQIEYYGVIFAPKILMALIGALGEFYLIKFVQKMYLLCLDAKEEKELIESKSVVQITTVLTLTNFFNCFLITRPFINTFEMDLTCIALYFWDWSGGDMINSSSFARSLALAFFICLQRPTNAFIWIPLGGFMVLNLISKGKFINVAQLFLRCITIFCAVLLANAAVDYRFYGEIVFPAFKFIRFNYTSSLSKFYGTAPWHFHILQSLPIILGYMIPFFVHGFFTKITSKKFIPRFSNPITQFKFVIISNLVLFSLINHKEFRFIYPLQPFFILFSALSLIHLKKRVSGLNQWIIWVVPCFSVIASLIICTSHETGVIEVMHYLHDTPNIESLGFIMPCHSTPWQSYLHRNDIADLWYITCEPPLHLMNDPNVHQKLPLYMDESDHLYDDIQKYIYQNFPPVFRKNLRTPSKTYKHEWPEFLVIFEHLDTLYMREHLKDSGYVELQRFFNSLHHWDSRRAGDVVVYYKPTSY